MPIIKKVKPGDKLKIPAVAYNAMATAAEAHSQNAFSVGPGKDEPGDNLILIKNNSGSAVPTGGSLGIDGPIYGPVDNLPEFKFNTALEGITPSADHVSKFIVTAEPINDGKIGRGYVAGICPALLEIVEITHITADIVDGELKTTVNGSAQILWMESDDEAEPAPGTDKWAIIRFGTTAQGTLVDPKEMYNTFEGDEAAQSDTWDATSQGVNDGVVSAESFRTVYKHDGDQVLYGYSRNKTSDSLGLLELISGESRYVIDTPEACEGNAFGDDG